MNFTPFNRHVVVDLIEESEENGDSLVVLPTDYKKPQSPFARCLVIQSSSDCKLLDEISLNDEVLVERRMLNKVDIKEYSFYLVLENYIYGRINDEID